MKSILHSSIALSIAAAVTFTNPASAADIERSTITEVVKDATVLLRATKGKKAARVNDVFGVPDVLRTGSDSRVEMIAEDQTVTRVGANTIFSFEPQKREINLQKGSVLFNSPSGKGGGTIRTAAATAAVQGTTLIVVTTQNGGFKALLLEGRGSVKSNGKTRSIGAGQMVYVLPGGDLSGVLNFHLAEQVGVARLVNGFKAPLASQDKIDKAVAKQEAQIAKGQLVTTGLLASDSPTQAYKVDPTIAFDVVRSPERAQRIVNSGQAGLADSVIAQPQLDLDRVFSALTDAPPVLGPGSGIAGDLPPDYSLYIARNTTVRTNAIDLSPYLGTFLFYSTGDFIVEQSVAIGGGPESVGIFALGTVRQVPGAFLDIDAANASVFALGLDAAEAGGAVVGSPLAFTGGGIRATGNLSLFAASFDLNQSVLGSQTGGVIASASTDFTAFGLGASAPQFVAPKSVTIFAGRNIDITNSVTSVLNSDFTAGNNMTLTNVAFLTSGGPAQSVNLSAGNLMSLTNVALQAQSVALDARTVTLTNVAFPALSNVTLRSETGLLATQPNTGRPVEVGKVNFIQNVTYGGSPAQNAVGSGISISKK